jgi:hypothetical protein
MGIAGAFYFSLPPFPLMRTLPKTCPYTFNQIKESGLFSDERIAKLEDLIAATPQKALTPEGKEIDSLLLVPTLKGEMVFIVENDNAREYMVRCMLPTFLTEEEQTTLQQDWGRYTSDKLFAQRLEKAKQAGKLIPAAKWNEGVYWNENYYSDIGSLYDDLADLDPEEDAIPEYVYAARPCQVISKLYAADLLENQIEQHGWEDMSVDDLKGLPEFEEALALFCEANKDVESFLEDTSTIIVVDYTPGS